MKKKDLFSVPLKYPALKIILYNLRIWTHLFTSGYERKHALVYRKQIVYFIRWSYSIPKVLLLSDISCLQVVFQLGDFDLTFDPVESTTDYFLILENITKAFRVVLYY